jgi:ubiquinone/menaquinone biosynthesis C-methylase UbiE
MTKSVHPEGSDCWGHLNDVPDVAPILAILDGLPAGFRDARRAMLGRLRLEATSRVLEAGSGPGTALADLKEFIGPAGRIVGLDPTRALVEAAETRARAAGLPQATYAVGDIRHIASADATFDAAFCDKILVHVGPASQAMAELARVTRHGGRVGAVEWYSQGMVVAAADYALTRRIMDGSARAAAFNPMLPLELEGLMTEAGLSDIESASVVAESHEALPSLTTMLTRRMQQAVEAGAVTEDDGAVWIRDLETRASRGEFYWAAIVRWAVGTKR